MYFHPAPQKASKFCYRKDRLIEVNVREDLQVPLLYPFLSRTTFC